jgi:hypothetical protein
MHFILKQILTHEEPDSNRKGVNPLRDELGIGSVTGVVADRFDNGSDRFGENPVRQLGRLGYTRWEPRLGPWWIGSNFGARLNRE